MDTWWQTETGGFMITPLPVVAAQARQRHRPFPGIEADVVDEEGNSCRPGEDGNLVIKQPWPAMLRTIYGDPERYVNQYWSKYREAGLVPGGRLGAQGRGRLLLDHRAHRRRDQGQRLSPGHGRSRDAGWSATRRWPKRRPSACPTKCAATSSTPTASCARASQAAPQLERRTEGHIRHEVGPIAVPPKIEFVEALPKTRSGKIMRRVLKARAHGPAEGDISTLEE